MATGTSIMYSTAAGLAVIGVLTYIVYIFNGIISLKNNIKKSWANIDVLLKQRSDEVPRLVECVKGYAKHEKGIMDAVTRARVAMMNAEGMSQKARADSEITSALKSIFALAENYPQLRANENFLELQARITGIENEIADRREFYNDSVNAYNTRIQTLPDVIVAKIMGYTQPEEFFKATDDEKKVVDVMF